MKKKKVKTDSKLHIDSYSSYKHFYNFSFILYKLANMF